MTRAKGSTQASDKKRTVVLTGISGNLGREVAKLLHRHFRVIGLDPRPVQGLPKDVEHYTHDYRRRRAENVFRRTKPYALVHLGAIHRLRQSYDEAHTFNVVGTQRLLEFCQRYKVSKVVFVSTADVYGPMPGQSHYTDEDVTLQGDLHYPEMRMAVAMDRMAQSFHWMAPSIETTLLRPVHMIGPRLKNAICTYLRLPVFPVIAGYDPMLQVIHQRDVIRAVQLALGRRKIHGIYNLSGTEAAPIRRVLEHLGKPLIPIPAPLARMAFEQLWRHSVLAFPPPELDHLQYSSVVDVTRMTHKLKFTPTYGWPEILEEIRATILAR
jgi:UDP-glucose 4-epimerase